MVAYIYIMTNKNNNVLYAGVTSNLIKRIYEHKSGLTKGFTSKYNINKLIYYELFEDIKITIQREKQIKSWNRKRKDELITSMNPDWRDLYNEII